MRVGLCVAELLSQSGRSDSISELDRYPVSNPVWGAVTESALRQVLKALSAPFVNLVSILETEEEVSGKRLFFPIDDGLSQRIAALTNISIVDDIDVDCDQK
uniref:Transcriptional regulator n=1 Tax=Echinococcus granulosus TaxID=6210 RepID=A0A068WZ37_ECHGR|nr:hypothetical protein EgrG_002063500 [Echinococcus granulosus]